MFTEHIDIYVLWCSRVFSWVLKGLIFSRLFDGVQLSKPVTRLEIVRLLQTPSLNRNPLLHKLVVNKFGLCYCCLSMTRLRVFVPWVGQCIASQPFKQQMVIFVCDNKSRHRRYTVAGGVGGVRLIPSPCCLQLQGFGYGYLLKDEEAVIAHSFLQSWNL